MIIDPWGKVLGERAEGEGLVLAEVDSALIHKVRSELPALHNRKLP